MKFNFTKGKNKSTELAVRMGISLVLALIIGSAFILLRETLIANDKTSIWNAINNILFQDITADEGRNSLGIFYILGQLFINCLQLIIIPTDKLGNDFRTSPSDEVNDGFPVLKSVGVGRKIGRASCRERV